MKLLFDESLSPRLVELKRDLFPDSESALQNGLAGAGDLKILEYASAGEFILVSTIPAGPIGDGARANFGRLMG